MPAAYATSAEPLPWLYNLSITYSLVSIDMNAPLQQSTNADPAEVQKFSDLAHRWWDPNSEFKPLHEINPLRTLD